MLKLCIAVLSFALGATLEAQQKIALVDAGSSETPSGHALHVLKEAFQRRGVPLRQVGSPRERKNDELLLTISTDLELPAESFSIRKASGGITVKGAGAVGLAYGIFELLGQVEASTSPDLLRDVSGIERRPEIKVRSMAMSLLNRDLEREWYFSKEFWNAHFALMAKSRFNQFTLIFGNQTSYLAPLFPFMIDVPGYERVRTPDYTDADRRQNVEALRMISALADEWGVRFNLGIWQQHANNYGPNMVQGLSYEDLFDYCPKALAILLKECPHIGGVQFRMNSESGIQEDDQNRFFTAMAKAIRSAGRPMWTDFRAKGLRPETVASFTSLGFQSTVSTKFWREHMGLPYHGTTIDPLDKQRSYRRYGFWDLLPHGRPYDVLYQMWTIGSQKILPWGSLDYARRFADATHLGDAVGFEVFAPLSEKGYLNWRGGDWHIFANRDLEDYRWEFERYWAFYLTLGLAGYSPYESQPVLDGEFRRRFGKAWPAMRDAYEAASWVIPFVTSVRNPSSSNFHYWPEMETGGLTDRYIQLSTGDDNRFYRVDEYVADTLQRRFSAKMTPLEMAARLDDRAAAIRAALKRAEPLPVEARKEFAANQIDFGVLGAIAEYHASRLLSAVDYQFFARTGERIYLLGAIAHYRRAVDHWTTIAKLTDGVFYDHMVFNRPPEQIGHWKDELPFLQADLKRLEEIDHVFVASCENAEQVLKWKIASPRAKMTMKWKEEHGVLTRWAETTPVRDDATGDLDTYSIHDPKSVVKNLLIEFRYAKILHAPLRRTEAGKPVMIHASILGPRGAVKLTLFYRLAGAGFRFTQVEMAEHDKNVYAAAIPAPRSGDTIYYYIRAIDQTEFFDGSEKEPHAIVVSAAKPSIHHSDIRRASVGTPVRVQAKVQSATKPAAVRLHYRHLDQAEDWAVVEMTQRAPGEYQAVIPGEFVVPGWDLMYAIEALDVGGSGSFYPDLEVREPFVVTQVKP